MNSRRLMISCQGIGNTILTFPVLKAFKDKGDLCDLVVSDNGSAQLAAQAELAGEIHIWKEKDGAFSNYARLSGACRVRRYDRAYALAPAGRRENVLLRLSGAKEKRGWRTNHFGRLLSFFDPAMPFWDETKHDLESNRILTGLEPDQIRRAIYSLRDHFCQNSPDSKKKTEKVLFGMQPFTKARFKCWPFERVKLFLSAIQKQIPSEILIFGAASETQELQRLAASVGGCFVIAGRPWREVIGCLNGLDSFIGVDSSMAHLAAVCGVPTCVLYGSTAPERVGALGENVVILKQKDAGADGYQFTNDYPSEGSLGLSSDHALNLVLKFIVHAKNHSMETFFKETAPAVFSEGLFFGGKLLKI